MLYNKSIDMNKKHSRSGITLVEVLIGLSIITTTLVAIGLAVNSYVDARTALLRSTKTAYLAEEGYEILRALRDDNWNTIDALPVDTVRYLTVSTTTIGVTNSPEIIDSIYRRSFIVRSVYRDVNDDIVSSTAPGAVIDYGSRKIEISVSNSKATTTLEAILANVYAI